MRIHKSILIILLLLFLIDWYVFQGVQTLSEGWQSLAGQQAVQLGYWVIVVGFMALLVYTGFKYAFQGKKTSFSQGVLNAFLTITITKLVLIVFFFGEDIFRMSVGAFNYAYSLVGGAVSAEGFIPHRSRLFSQVAFALAAIPFFSFVYGITKGKYRYVVHKHTLHFEDLPENFDGFTITQVSDIHSGSLENAAAVQEGIELIKAQKSDLFVFTGDLVNNQAHEIEPWIKHFSQIKAPYGQYSILGNHDYGSYMAWRSAEDKQLNFEALKQNHARLGYRLLLDESVSIEKGGQKISLLGVENWGVGFGQRGDLQRALNRVDKSDFKILLSHDPSHWDQQVKSHPAHIHLTLSGHTHGMQFGIELGGFRWSPVQYRYKNWAGLVQEAGRYLYVNRGFGFHGFSGRIGIWPEVTVLELRRAKKAA
jgi:uncharacterized protein